jgi:protein-disulfide isomerase
MSLQSRGYTIIGAVAVIAVILAAAFYFYRGNPIERAVAQISASSELLEPGPLGDKALGSPDAPVTVIEYASMSCPHCGAFHRETFDAFKEKYIDTGKVRFIFREFPLNSPAYVVAMLARCAPEDRFFTVIDAYFDQQDRWMTQEDIKGAIFDLAKQLGFTQQSFDACLSNQAIFTGLEDSAKRGASFGVQATPTFFINGKKAQGALTLEQLDKEIEPLL